MADDDFGWKLERIYRATGVTTSHTGARRQEAVET
jgi:hypothetical protein